MLLREILITSQYPAARSLHQLKPDIFLSIADRILPLHRGFLQDCEHVRQEFSEKKIYIIDDPLDPDMLEQVLGLFYGKDVKLCTKKELMAFLDVVDYLQAEKLRGAVQDEIGSTLENYDLFFILELAYRFSLTRVFALAFEALEAEEFEQINYNKFDFILCDFKLFQVVLRRHHSLKAAGKILGQSTQIIEETITLYCRRYHFDAATEERLMEKYGSAGKLALKISPKTDRSSVDPLYKELKTDRPIAASIKFDSVPKNQKRASVEHRVDAKKNYEQKSTSPESNMVSSARLLKDARGKTPDLKTEKPEPLFKFGGDSTKQKKEPIPSPIPEEPQGFDRAKFRESPHKRVRVETPSRRVETDSLGNLEEEEDPESMAGKISTLLDQYVMAYHEHEDKFEEMKKNARSMIFRQNSQKETARLSIFNAGRIAMSRGLERNILSDTLQIPEQ